jgi:hypothetical protein
MKYKGQELTEYKTTESIFFDKPKKMLVWDDASTAGLKSDVVAVIPRRESYPVIGVKHTWKHCAEIPEEPKKKLATYRELARWLAEGNGEMKAGSELAYTHMNYNLSRANSEADSTAKVRKWEDTEWVAPTREYLGLED